MKVRPIHFVADLAAALRFYEALGLATDVRSRSGHFVTDEPLEAVERRLREAGFQPEGTIVDQEWGRSLLVPGPDGAIVQIDEQDRELYT